MDLDLLLFGNVEMQTDILTIPHPLMAERRFVLEPAAEIAPEMLHPTRGKTISQILAELRHLQQPTQQIIMASPNICQHS